MCQIDIKGKGITYLKSKNKKRIVDDIEQEFILHENQNIPIKQFETTKKAHGRIDSSITNAIYAVSLHKEHIFLILNQRI